MKKPQGTKNPHAATVSGMTLRLSRDGNRKHMDSAQSRGNWAKLEYWVPGSTYPTLPCLARLNSTISGVEFEVIKITRRLGVIKLVVGKVDLTVLDHSWKDRTSALRFFM